VLSGVALLHKMSGLRSPRGGARDFVKLNMSVDTSAVPPGAPQISRRTTEERWEVFTKRVCAVYLCDVELADLIGELRTTQA